MQEMSARFILPFDGAELRMFTVFEWCCDTRKPTEENAMCWHGHGNHKVQGGSAPCRSGPGHERRDSTQGTAVRISHAGDYRFQPNSYLHTYPRFSPKLFVDPLLPTTFRMISTVRPRPKMIACCRTTQLRGICSC